MQLLHSVALLSCVFLASLYLSKIFSFYIIIWHQFRCFCPPSIWRPSKYVAQSVCPNSVRPLYTSRLLLTAQDWKITNLAKFANILWANVLNTFWALHLLLLPGSNISSLWLNAFGALGPRSSLSFITTINCKIGSELRNNLNLKNVESIYYKYHIFEVLYASLNSFVQARIPAWGRIGAINDQGSLRDHESRDQWVLQGLKPSLTNRARFVRIVKP